MFCWSMAFPGRAECVREARQFATKVIGEDRPGIETVLLVVSELATNAVLHTASGETDGMFTLRIAAFSDHWQIRVDDQGSRNAPHVEHEPDDDDGLDAESGRGLALVADTSRSWGVLGDQYARTVWAEIPYPSPTPAIDLAEPDPAPILLDQTRR